MNSLWSKLAECGGVLLQARQADLLSRYLDLLLEANQRMNLTRITDRAAAEVQHIGDALTLLKFLPRKAIPLADVGSGGGVPGIPLAIARPDVKVLLIESTRKKALFLKEAARQLELENVAVTDERAEAVARSNRRESFDVVSARAAGSMAWLAEWCLPLARKGGIMLAMKGAKVNEELEAASRPIKMLGGGEPVVHGVELPGVEHHVIVRIEKIGRTDVKYPRDPTRTGGKPLS